MRLFSGFGSGAFFIHGILLVFQVHPHPKSEFNILSKNHSFLTTGTTKLIDHPLGMVFE